MEKNKVILCGKNKGFVINQDIFIFLLEDCHSKLTHINYVKKPFSSILEQWQESENKGAEINLNARKQIPKIEIIYMDARKTNSEILNNNIRCH